MPDIAASPRPSSSLTAANNDTGRIAFCGPYVLSAITGYPISRIEEIIRDHREVPEGARGAVKGTTADDVAAALARFGYRLDLTQSYMHLARKERPTLWTWMQRPRNAWTHYVLAVHKGKEGHWILIKGVKLCDTFTEGRWTFVCDGPHRGARIMEVFEVRKELGC